MSIFKFAFSKAQRQVGEHRLTPAAFFGQCVAAYLDRIGAKPGVDFLDIGSRREWLAGMASAWPLTSLDIRPREALGRLENVRVGSATDMPFPDATFDVVTSWGTFCVVGLGRYDAEDGTASEKMISEIARVLRPGGYCILEARTGQQAKNRFRIDTHSRIDALCSKFRFIKVESRKLDVAPTSGHSGFESNVFLWRKAESPPR